MERLTRLSVNHPWTTLAVVGLITLVLGAGLPKVRNEYGYRVLIGDEHPTIVQLDNFIERFGGGLPIMVAWECGPGKPCQHALDAESLRVADSITRAAQELPTVRNVIGPANAPLLTPGEGGFAVRRLIENGEIVPDLAELREVALEDPMWRSRLFEPNGASAVVYVQSVDSESETGSLLIDSLDEILDPFRLAGYEFKLIGDFVGTVIGGRRLTQSMSRVIPLLVLVIGAILVLLTRSWRASLLALATMGIALLWTVGLLGWLGWPQDGIHEVLAPLVLVVGVCDAVHLLSRIKSPGTMASARDRLISAARRVGPPCLVTTTTTAVAFASFTTSPLDSFYRFGSISVFGVIACLFLSFTLLPVLASWFEIEGSPANASSRIWARGLNATIEIGGSQRALVLTATVVLLLGGAIGWTQLEADNDWIEGFGRTTDISQWIQFADERYRTAHTLEVDLSPAADLAIESPEVLTTAETLIKRLQTLHELGDASSVLDRLRMLNQLLNDNDPAFYRIGDSREANAELIELIGLDDPEMLSAWVSLDRRSLRISLKTSVVPFSRQKVLMKEVETIVSEVIPASWSTTLTGALPVNRDWVRDVQQTQLRSFPTAFLLVLILVSWHLRSIRYGLFAMLPTLVPVVITLGTMGWLGVTLDIGRAMVAAIVIGIGVDDAIHFLSAYKEARERGLLAAEATQEAIETTGRAIVTTSFALSLGFLTLTGSAWQTISSFGFFVSFTIVTALIATLFMLPAMLCTFDNRSEEP